MNSHVAPVTIANGFEDPVFDSQAVFRDVLNALSRPGVVVEIGQHAPETPSPLPSAMGAFLLAMADYETPIWLSPAFNQPAVKAWISFNCGAAVTDERAAAKFAPIDVRQDGVSFEGFALGDDRYPDQSATLLLLCDGFEGGDTILLTGPGIETSATITPRVPASLWSDLTDNAMLFPRGLDVFLIADTRILGLPRTTHVSGGAR